MDYPIEQGGYLIERDLLTALAWYVQGTVKEKEKEDRDREGVD